MLVRLLRSRHGRFDFAEHTEPSYVTGQRFDIEDVLGGVEARVLEWADIESVIPIEDATIHLARDLGGRDEVTISGDTWRIIAGLGSASTVDGVADLTGLSDFVVARTMAELVKQGLLQVRVAAEPRPSAPAAQESEDIRVTPAVVPSIVDRALAHDGNGSPSPEEGGIVEFFRRPDDLSGTTGW